MGKNDFDIDFDFEKEYGFDPKTLLGSDANDDTVDLNEFSDEELGLSSQNPAPGTSEDADNSLFEDEDLNGDFDADAGLDDFLNMGREAEEEEQTYDEDDPEDFSDAEDYPDHQMYDPDLSGAGYPEEMDMNLQDQEFEDPQQYDPEQYDPDYPDFDDGEQPEEADEEHPRRKKTAARPKRKAPKVNLPKIAMPNIFGKFYDVYFAPVFNKELREPAPDPKNPRRRRRKAPIQIFKEVYLPPIIACVCLVLVMSFVIGALTDFIQLKKDEADRAESHLSSSISAAEQEAQRVQQVMDEAEALVTGYDYDGAIALLQTLDVSNEEVAAKIRDYSLAKDQLKAHQDPNVIPNLSFHVLIEDTTRAFADQELGGSYNRNFVTTGEFRKILQQLYDNGYVLVDFDSFTGSNKDTSGNDVFATVPIYLPEGKKPVMITETMVNYYLYMVDSNEDGVADAGGDGFASKLVISNGEIKNEYVNASGETLVGDYDLVPILESFIKEHPDFSYRGARATLAVSGKDGVLGYRCTNEFVATKGQDYVDQEKAQAMEVAKALKEKGYTFACYTFGDVAYASYSVQQISADIQSWTQQVLPVLGGDCNIFIFAKTSGLTSYGTTSQAFNAIYNSGFRYFITHGTQPSAEVNTNYVRQNRLMVTGEYMQHYANYFNNTSYTLFDASLVLDSAARGNVPTG